MSQSKFTIAETFVGCGGAHFGFKKSGYETIFVNDIWGDALKTLKINENELTDNQIIHEDINKLTKETLDNRKLSYQDVDVFIGGVVCKGFSLAGVRNPYDERNYLYLEQLRLVNIIRPKISIIENVPAMLNMKILNKNNTDSVKNLCNELSKLCDDHKKTRGQLIAAKKNYAKENTNENQMKVDQLKQIMENITVKRKQMEKDLDQYKYSVVADIERIYNEMGYNVHKKVLMCSDYNCATNRKRLFIVATRRDLNLKWEYPEPTTHDNKPTVKDAFDLLDYQGANNPETDVDNRPMNHRPSTVEKFKKVLVDKKEQGAYFSRGTSSRLSYYKPAPTLVPGHSSFQIHPTEHRSITVREGGIITGFDKNFKFYGSHTSRCMQIGNAIPVNMAYHLAEQCKKVLSN